MNTYSLTHLSDQVLLRDLASLVARDRSTTAGLLAHIAEVDTRRLYLPAAYPSMFAYCVHELHLSEDAAAKRIQAARAARRFPVIFQALADGRLHLTGVGMLAPCLTPENAADLLATASHKTKSEIEELIAQRFPRSETIGLVQVLPASSPPRDESSAPGRIEALGPERAAAFTSQHAPAHVGPLSKVTPVAPDRVLLQLTIGRDTQGKLRHAQELLGHRLPSGDIAQVLDRALDALIEKLEKRKFAATTRPCRSASQHPSTNPRHIPARVKRAVWERDGGQCTFASETGRRCAARKLLEFDHVEEVARGGRASVTGIRLRCRAHNQYGAECSFGTEFMNHKRQEARRATADANAAKAQVAAEARAAAAAAAAAERAKLDVVPWLRQLGYRADEARRAAARCEAIPDAPIEERVRLALAFLCPRTVSRDFRPAEKGSGTGEGRSECSLGHGSPGGRWVHRAHREAHDGTQDGAMGVS